MPRKTKPRRSSPFRWPSSQRHWNVTDAARVEKPLSLVCGACGASGRYNVGTVTLDPAVAKSPDGDAIEKAVGFTGYFRCRKCDAGGPWELPHKTVAYRKVRLSNVAVHPNTSGTSSLPDKAATAIAVTYKTVSGGSSHGPPASHFRHRK